MARIARIVVPGLPHHVTQRGNRRERTFFGDDDYALYRDLLAQACRKFDVAVWAYCLMPNHVHLILCPSDASGLALALSRTHRRYAGFINARGASAQTGHLFQGRFGSVAMDEAHLMDAARYVALNPVAGRDWSSGRRTGLGPARGRISRRATMKRSACGRCWSARRVSPISSKARRTRRDMLRCEAREAIPAVRWAGPIFSRRSPIGSAAPLRRASGEAKEAGWRQVREVKGDIGKYAPVTVICPIRLREAK